MKTTSQAAKSGTPESAVLCVSRWNSAPMVAAPATATKPLNISFPIEARCQSGRRGLRCSVWGVVRSGL